MNLDNSIQQHVHQVLIEENPWVGCKNISDRPIVYEGVSYLIAEDLYTEQDKEEVIEQHLDREFGRKELRNLDRIKVRLTQHEFYGLGG